MVVVNHRRDRHEIVSEILKCAIGGKIRTHIMRKAKLSYFQMQEFLPLLVENGFLENTIAKHKKRSHIMFMTTGKGKELLRHLESVNKLWTVE